MLEKLKKVCRVQTDKVMHLHVFVFILTHSMQFFPFACVGSTQNSGASRAANPWNWRRKEIQNPEACLVFSVETLVCVTSNHETK